MTGLVTTAEYINGLVATAKCRVYKWSGNHCRVYKKSGKYIKYIKGLVIPTEYRTSRYAYMLDVKELLLLLLVFYVPVGLQCNIKNHPCCPCRAIN